MSSHYKDLFNAIDEILWNDWDPIGINNEAPRDEYRSYVPEMVKLKMNKADLEIIAKTLHKLETESMGVAGDIEHCRKIAQKIILL